MSAIKFSINLDCSLIGEIHSEIRKKSFDDLTVGCSARGASTSGRKFILRNILFKSRFVPVLISSVTSDYICCFMAYVTVMYFVIMLDVTNFLLLCIIDLKKN